MLSAPQASLTLRADQTCCFHCRQISYFQKTSKPKKRVSLICLTHSFDRDLLNSLRSDSHSYESSVVGPLFPIQADCIYNKVLPTNVDSGSSFIALLAEATKVSNSSDAPAHPMAKQAVMFTSLIAELLESGLDNSASVVPSLHALQQCLRSGWQPQSIAEVSMVLLIVCRHRVPNVRYVNAYVRTGRD